MLEKFRENSRATQKTILVVFWTAYYLYPEDTYTGGKGRPFWLCHAQHSHIAVAGQGVPELYPVAGYPGELLNPPPGHPK